MRVIGGLEKSSSGGIEEATTFSGLRKHCQGGARRHPQIHENHLTQMFGRWADG